MITSINLGSTSGTDFQWEEKHISLTVGNLE